MLNPFLEDTLREVRNAKRQLIELLIAAVIVMAATVIGDQLNAVFVSAAVPVAHAAQN